MNRCANCLHEFTATECQCQSSILGAADITLCEKCSKLEEQRITMLGTNDLPGTLEKYHTLLSCASDGDSL
jgi:hypothetical protein